MSGKDTDDPGLDAAHALSGPEDTRTLYARRADTCDRSFAMAMDFRLHEQVAGTKRGRDAGPRRPQRA